MGKGKAHYIEVLSNSEEEEEAKQAQDCEQKKSIEEHPHGEAKSGAITTLSSVPRFHTFRIRVLYRVSESQYRVMVGKPTIYRLSLGV
jgi:hypothetical protein